MAKPDKILHDNDLELFFEAARQDAPEPSDALLAAILADAQAQQPRATSLSPECPKENWFRGLLSIVGGWPAAASLATATVAGVWLGFTQPVQLETLSGGLVLAGDYATTDTTYALDDLAPSYLSATLFTEDEV